MKKVAIVYYSSTGNTEKMAEAVAEGARKAGAEVDVFTCDAFDVDSVMEYDSFGFGCPAMGEEVLEETVFEPMFAEIEGDLVDKKAALFGSYGWGDGAWMEGWQERCISDGMILVADGLIAHEEPDAEKLAACEALGALLA